MKVFILQFWLDTTARRPLSAASSLSLINMTWPGCRLTLLQTSRWHYTGTGTDLCEAINMNKHFKHLVAARIVYEYVAGARRVHNNKRLWKKILLEPSPSRADGAVCSGGQTSWDPGVAPKLCSFTAVYGVFEEVWCSKAQRVLQETVQENTEYRLDYYSAYLVLARRWLKANITKHYTLWCI